MKGNQHSLLSQIESTPELSEECSISESVGYKNSNSITMGDLAYIRDPTKYNPNIDYGSVKNKRKVPHKYRYNIFYGRYEESYWRYVDNEDAESGSSIDSDELHKRERRGYNYRTGEKIPGCCNTCTIL